MTVKVRFAPSPTGRIHIGNTRMAVLNWLFAKRHGGTFVLRSDDTDTARSTREYENDIMADLAWLGLNHDEFFRQSERFAVYDAVAEKLKAMGRLYACYETAEELDLRRKVLQSQGKPPVYDRAGLHLTDEQRAEYESQGRKPHWRFLLNEDTITWDDLARGTQKFTPGHLSDPVLIRNDGTYLYTLPSVVDDGDTNITHVIRGEDHTANTAVQIQIIKALGYPIPTYAHLSLLVGADGKGLSKRLGSLSITDLRQQGIHPMAIVGALGLLGTNTTADGSETLDDLINGVDLSGFGRASPRFDPADLDMLTLRIHQRSDFADVQELLAQNGIPNATPEFWELVRENIADLPDTAYWWNVIYGDITPQIAPDDADYIATAKTALPQGEITADTWGQWTSALKEQTDRKGKSLFLPLRLALTGRPNGPEVKTLLPHMGRDRILARLGA